MIYFRCLNSLKNSARARHMETSLFVLCFSFHLVEFLMAQETESHADVHTMRGL